METSGKIKDRIYRLGDLDQEDEEEAGPGFMRPEAHETREHLQKWILLCKGRFLDSW